MSKVREAILGNSYFANKIMAKLHESTALQCAYFDTSNRRSDQLRYLFYLPFSSVVYSASGCVRPGMALRAAMLLRKRIRLHFIGSDVLTAIEDVKTGRADSSLMSHARYAANAPWLVRELEEVGVSAQFLPSMIDEHQFIPAPLPTQFTVLTYVGQGNEDFYGIDLIRHLAQSCPDIPITVVGSTQVGERLSFPNVKLRGWVEEIASEISKHVVLLRLTKHDGISHLVVQALLTGRWVIRTNDHTGVSCIRSTKELVDNVRDLQARFKAGKLGLNEEGRSWAEKEFESTQVVRNIATFITN